MKGALPNNIHQEAIHYRPSYVNTEQNYGQQSQFSTSPIHTEGTNTRHFSNQPSAPPFNPASTYFVNPHTNGHSPAPIQLPQVTSYPHVIQGQIPHGYPQIPTTYGSATSQIHNQPGNLSVITPQDPWTALRNVNMFVIEQQTHMMEAATQGAYEQANEYKIFTNSGLHILNAKEDSGCCARTCCHPNHKLTLHVQAVNPYSSGPSQFLEGNDIFTVHKPFKCCCCAVCPCFQKEVIIRTAVPEQVIGYVKQPCFGGFCRPKLKIYDRPYGNYQGYLTGPCCCIGGFCDVTFTVYDTNGNKIGKIEKKGVKDMASMGTEMFTDSDKYALSFPMNIDTKLKATLFGTLLFVDYLFFEDEGNFECNPCRPSCAIKCCDIYCCGSTIPCKINCAGGSRGNDSVN